MFFFFWIYISDELNLSYVFDLQETIPIEEVFENLRCSREGLTSDDAQKRLVIFGQNKLEEKEVYFWMIFLFFYLWFFLLNFLYLLVFRELKKPKQ